MSDALITRTVNGVLFTRTPVRGGRAIWTAEHGLACRIVEVPSDAPALVGPIYRVSGEGAVADLADFRVVARKEIRRRRAEISAMRAEVMAYDRAAFSRAKPRGTA